MQHDEVIWQAIRHNHCSFMAKITTGNFCTNPYNVTGICNRSSCPLANSRYATIREHEGVFYLYMKTIERAHKPNQLWERLKLPRNYEKAIELINKHMMYWPKLLVHKTKQRLTKMTQMRIRMHTLARKTRERVMTIPRKEIKREARREEKAEKAAVLDKSIERELLTRLMTGLYPHHNNSKVPDLEVEEEEETTIETQLDEQEYLKVIDSDEEEEEDPEIEYVEGYDELEKEDNIEDFDNITVRFYQDHDDETMKRRLVDSDHHEKVDAKSKKTRVMVEVEHEDAFARQKKTV